jgi:hypothetical protein
MSGINRWDRARMAAGISRPGWPHDEILRWATRLHCLDMAEGKPVAASTFDDLPEKDRATYLARSARITVNPDDPLHPDSHPTTRLAEREGIHIPDTATGAPQ